MKFTLSIAVVAASLAVVCVGCKKDTSATAEMERAAQVMQQPAPAPAPTPAPAGQPAEIQQVVVQQPAQQMNQAMTAFKAGDYQDAVTRLQALRAQTTMSPEQRMALQDAMASVMTEVYQMAAKGDARAQQAVKDYERLQNSRR